MKRDNCAGVGLVTGRKICSSAGSSGPLDSVDESHHLVMKVQELFTPVSPVASGAMSLRTPMNLDGCRSHNQVGSERIPAKVCNGNALRHCASVGQRMTVRIKVLELLVVTSFDQVLRDNDELCTEGRRHVLRLAQSIPASLHRKPDRDEKGNNRPDGLRPSRPLRLLHAQPPWISPWPPSISPKEAVLRWGRWRKHQLQHLISPRSARIVARREEAAGAAWEVDLVLQPAFRGSGY